MTEQGHPDPRRQAWLYSFLDENHLHYATSPDMVASPAQLRFMLELEPEEPYYPCSETIFEEIMARVKSPVLGEEYAQAWARIHRLIRDKIEEKAKADYLVDLLNIKYQHETANYNMIPSRVEKRLHKLFMVTTQIEDPQIRDKTNRNRRAASLMEGATFTGAVNRVLGEGDRDFPGPGESLEDLRRRLDAAKLRRLLMASVQSRFWEADGPEPTAEDWASIFENPVQGDGWEALLEFLLTPDKDLAGHWVPRRILYIADTAGQIVFDLAVIHFLVRLGHTVILSVKSAAFYDRVYLGDLVNDPTLRPMTEEAEVVTHPKLTKNQLAGLLRNDQRFKIITDGTMEKLNLALTSVTFARVFKEVDGIIAKGPDNHKRLFDTRFRFTQDVYCLDADPSGNLGAWFKPHGPKTIRFTSADLEDRAEAIVSQMRAAKEKGWSVMFYSGIVGSVPGETDTAIKVMTTFVDHLSQQQAQTHIINPSAHFIQGMDADDLMYMWEIVQRSGLIDIWRFQTYQDIETSFQLLGRKVPPQWVGKDSTFSTGCTKEMAIAQDVQKRYPEMQIIGPDPEKFSRRGEYGIGLFHDTRLRGVVEY